MSDVDSLIHVEQSTQEQASQTSFVIDIKFSQEVRQKPHCSSFFHVHFVSTQIFGKTLDIKLYSDYE